MRKQLLLACLLAASPLLSLAAPPPKSAMHATPVRLTEADRKVTAGRILLKWGGYVEKAYGQNRKAWAAALWPSLASADLDNLQKASRAITFEGMHGALLGQRVDDDQVIDRMARASLKTGARGGEIKRLGDLNQDLVFTPISSCRIADSRFATNPQRIAPGKSRAVVTFSPTGFKAFGGVDGDCGLPANVSALAVSVVGLENTSTGFLRVTPSFGSLAQGSTVPLTTINTTFTNDMLVESSIGAAGNASLVVSSTANTHFAVFVTGYFMPPQATTLECVSVAAPTAKPVAGEFKASTATCPSTYRITAVTCSTNSTSLRMTGTNVNHTNNAGTCTFFNASTETLADDVFAGQASCCRVPGR